MSIKKYLNLIGQRFGKLVVIRKIGQDAKTGKTRWRCKCDCGKSATRTTSKLRCGQSKSCGCWWIKHGMYDHPVFRSWKCMTERCYTKTNIGYRKYGGAGIFVCEFLRLSPRNLLLVLGNRSDDQTIDRIDNSKSYTCGSCDDCLKNKRVLNVKWSTKKQQNRNRSNTRMVDFNGVKISVSELSEKCGIRYSTLAQRWVRGFRDDSILYPRIKGNRQSNPK